MNRLAARSTDPLTSCDAAEKVEASGKAAAQRAIAVKAVEANPGRTSYELSRLCDLDRYKGPVRDCMVTGNGAVTWWPAAMLELVR